MIERFHPIYSRICIEADIPPGAMPIGCDLAALRVAHHRESLGFTLSWTTTRPDTDLPDDDPKDWGFYDSNQGGTTT